MSNQNLVLVEKVVSLISPEPNWKILSPNGISIDSFQSNHMSLLRILPWLLHVHEYQISPEQLTIEVGPPW